MFFIPPAQGDTPSDASRKQRNPIDRAWAELAETGSEYDDRGTPPRPVEVFEGRRGAVKALHFPYRAWTLVLDRHDVSGEASKKHVRVRAVFRCRSSFRLHAARETVLYRIAKALGLPDVVAGHPELDRAFVISSDNESMARSLLLDPQLVQQLLDPASTLLSVTPLRPLPWRRAGDLAELRYVAAGLVKDAGRLMAILDVARIVLNGLERIGAARAEDPGRLP